MLTKGQESFVAQMSRKLLVGWCDESLRLGIVAIPESVYKEFARSKGWISADGSKVLAQGWETAAAFLKR